MGLRHLLQELDDVCVLPGARGLMLNMVERGDGGIDFLKTRVSMRDKCANMSPEIRLRLHKAMDAWVKHLLLEIVDIDANSLQFGFFFYLTHKLATQVIVSTLVVYGMLHPSMDAARIPVHLKLAWAHIQNHKRDTLPKIIHHIEESCKEHESPEFDSLYTEP